MTISRVRRPENDQTRTETRPLATRSVEQRRTTADSSAPHEDDPNAMFRIATAQAAAERVLASWRKIADLSREAS